MLNRILIFGLIAGLVVGVPQFVLTVSGANQLESKYSMLIGYTIMLIALSAVFAAIKRRRDVDLGGVIRFWPAFALGLGVSVIAGVLYVASWEAAMAVTHMDFAGGYAKAMIAHAEARGVTGPALAKVVAEMDDFKRQYANPLYRLPMTFIEIFPVGVLVSLISAALLRNSRFLPARGA